jgi:hypothetical protein
LGGGETVEIQNGPNTAIVTSDRCDSCRLKGDEITFSAGALESFLEVKRGFMWLKMFTISWP